MSREGRMKDAILTQMEKNLAAAMQAGNKREVDRINKEIEAFEIKNAHIKRERGEEGGR